jgi:leucyl-tRNA synthetase
MMDYKEIEEKWNSAWEGSKIFESEPNDKPSYMVTAAFPYANMPQHIGHLRTYGTADALARYKRMRGYNVLYPMAIHATGTPVLAIAKRMEEKDPDLIEELKSFGVDDEAMSKMTDPLFIADYFGKELESGMHVAGYSMDWRRRFVTIEPFFSKFIEWQFGILNEKGYLTKGKHPVGWCPNDNNAVGMHDTKHDVEPEMQKEVAIKFGIEGEDAKTICVTFRPETIPGVTNIFVNDKAQYALCEIGIEKFYIARAAIKELGFQLAIHVIREVSAQEMLTKICINPFNGDKVPVLPGFFVKEDLGTGVVMSVPAHAPFDYAAIQRLRKSGYKMPEITPKKVLDVKIGRSLSDVSVGEAKPSQMDIPAMAYLEVLHTSEDAIDDMLEFATKLEYREESHWGKMIIAGWEGMSEPEARDKMYALLASKESAFEVYTLKNSPVYCRCGEKVVVKVVDDQWFLNYGNPEWKVAAKEAFSKMSILPEKLRNTYMTAIDWIDLRAVARARGLGTKFPLDRNFIIESLSDSTIYPAFYTISHIIRDLPVESLKPEFFDYVMKGKGKADDVAKSTGIDYAVIKRCRDSFTYWYRETSRHSGSDLVFNHLTMYIFNHVAIFEKENWPKQIVTNALVNYEGEKMSKSLGNIVPLKDGIKKYGGDILRIIEIGGTDLFTDSEFSVESAEGAKERLQYLYNAVEKLDGMEGDALKRIDYWLYSKLNNKIDNATEAMDKLELRDVVVDVIYNSVMELRKYFNRGGNNALVLKEYLSGITLMLQPIAPHVSEELWHMLGNKSFVSLERWPEANKDMQSQIIEKGEELVESTGEDARQVIALMQKKTGKKAQEIRIIIAEDWKRRIVNALVKEKDVGRVMDGIKDDAKIDKEAAAKILAGLAKRINEIREVSGSQKDEFESFDEARDYLGKMLGCSVIVEKESDSKSERASRAMPQKPSLDITFA